MLRRPLRGSDGILGVHFPTLKRGANERCAYGADTVESLLQPHGIHAIAGAHASPVCLNPSGAPSMVRF